MGRLSAIKGGCRSGRRASIQSGNVDGRGRGGEKQHHSTYEKGGD